MLRAPRLIAALLITALSPAALAQKSSGHMDLDDLSSVYGAQLAAFRVMISKTDAICPQQTGLFRIAPNGLVTDIEAILWLVPERGFAIGCSGRQSLRGHVLAIRCRAGRSDEIPGREGYPAPHSEKTPQV